MVSIVFYNNLAPKSLTTILSAVGRVRWQKILVCVLWGNNNHQQGVLLFLCKRNVMLIGDRICMFCIQLKHDHFGWEVWDYIPPWCPQRWPTQGSKHIHSYLWFWRGWWYKSVINQCKWNKHCLWKRRCWERAWLWWDHQSVCRFLLGK